jgi:23S rRNA (uracil1939-C5)-methyltransferase
MPITQIESLDRDGRGVSHMEGKAIFIEGALPGETVEYSSYRKKPSYEVAQAVDIINASSARTDPSCPWYARCGGCSLQHYDLRGQIAAKQRILEDAMWHIGRVSPERIFSPIHGPSWHYRHRARLSVRLVPKKGGILVGFHERKSSYVVEMSSCEVLPQHVSAAIPELKRLVERLSIRDRIPQIEVAIGESASVLVFRILEPLGDNDKALLSDFADASGFQIWLQPKGPDTARLFAPVDAAALDYLLPEFGVRIGFLPTDFTQVNHAVNRILVRRAMDLLAPQHDDLVGDFFCGLGNFSLPIARLGARVYGVEGNEQLVGRARHNALSNKLSCQFDAANLFDEVECESSLARMGPLTKALIDPPREGAMELVKQLVRLSSLQKIVYVSCDPATLARDAGLLNQAFNLIAAGVVNMFPHTSHVESIAVFQRRLIV